MKLFIQIPCLNEETTLPSVLESMPTEIDGIDEIEILIIDDGSTDRTVEVAKSYGVTHFVRHTTNMGLARSFRDGVDYALLNGADIVVNTDGDNQYPQSMIPELVQPIIRGEAEIVVGDRQTKTIEHFSAFKKTMQRLGSWVVSQAAGLDLPDAASGFRAYSKYSLIRLNIVTQFSYCMETIVQAGYKRLAITSIPITTNAKTRESRLFSNIFQHMFQSGSAIVRAYLMYRPVALFLWISAVLAVGGLIPFVRYLILLATHDAGANIQSLLLGLLLIISALLSLVIGVVADLTRINRTLAEETLDFQKLQRYGE
ncbi:MULTISPECIES: glycosyltransferase family 2 protein [unclassified Frondihabitans]|uniref:glycosyltransferase family 2 protein n=1 Tax=unclassified Frondihabitans TaxID=2626248 RepID=UPI0006F747A0|nr:MULTISPECIES: glycosyltransferase family 2 protein [unclassified Frondihabitans]KQQ28046.1 glycosyl transferase [Frondihabitans sp. Leaf304]RPE79065.1 glycosyltransferase involved in cell wall biosynthesis [Frondihabitans sp. PhB153]RPF09345.1 glycosyltransferase involved in cell wall biosynthesis [Frondihabitans sp. PhB161]